LRIKHPFDTSQYLRKQTMQNKRTMFFKTINDLMDLISSSDRNNFLCNVILLVNLFRVILLPWVVLALVGCRTGGDIAVMGCR